MEIEIGSFGNQIGISGKEAGSSFQQGSPSGLVAQLYGSGGYLAGSNLGEDAPEIFDGLLLCKGCGGIGCGRKENTCPSHVCVWPAGTASRQAGSLSFRAGLRSN